jgi:ZIP family zinc transporter
VWVTAAAGIGGTGLGGGAACLLRRQSDRAVSLLLSFAAGVMVAVVCFQLLTEALDCGSLGRTAGSVLVGFGVTAALERWLERQNKTKSLALAGVMTAAAIALHNVPEGIVIGAAFAGGRAAGGGALALVIGLHNIPEGMAVAAPVAAGTGDRLRAAGLAALAGAPTVLGAVLGYRLGTLGPAAMTAALGAASGAMLYVVFGELLPEAAALWHSRLPSLAAVAGLLLGMLFARW